MQRSHICSVGWRLIHSRTHTQKEKKDCKIIMPRVWDRMLKESLGCKSFRINREVQMLPSVMALHAFLKSHSAFLQHKKTLRIFWKSSLYPFQRWPCSRDNLIIIISIKLFMLNWMAERKPHCIKPFKEMRAKPTKLICWVCVWLRALIITLAFTSTRWLANLGEGHFLCTVVDG